MPKKDPIESFGFAEHVAEFLLHESFRYAHEAAAYEVASILFGKKLEKITIVDPEWKPVKMPSSLHEWYVNQDEITDKATDPGTLEKLADAWYSSLDEAYESKIKIPKMTKLNSTSDIVGHVVNLTISLEGSLNRHLFYLCESQQLANEHYKSIDRSEVMPKILFCFKENILNKTLHIDRIRQLISMRNSAVHYRVDSPETLRPSIEDFLGIWKQLSHVFNLTYGDPSQENVQEFVDGFISRWVS